MHARGKAVEMPDVGRSGRPVMLASGREAAAESPARALQQRLERVALRSFYTPALDQPRNGRRLRRGLLRQSALVITGCATLTCAVIVMLADKLG